MRDYAQKQGLNEKRPSLKKTSRSEIAPAWGWTILGIGLGLGIAILVAIKLFPILAGIDRNLAATHEVDQDEVAVAPPEPKSPKGKTIETAAAPQPKFDFYTLLPSIEEDMDAPLGKTEQPEKVVQTPSSPPPTTTRIASSETANMASPLPDSTKTLSTGPKTDSFILQAAVFQSKEPAETLKAQLILQGFETKIEPYQKDSARATWYRVYLGPFEQMAEAKEAQSALSRTAQVDSFIIKSKA